MPIEDLPPKHEVGEKKLMFGTIGAAVAWVSLGCIDILINWRACQHQEMYGIPPAETGARILIGCVGIALLLVTVLAGYMNYSHWRKLTRSDKPLHDLGVRRSDYMTIVGMVVTATMGMGVFWLTLTPIFLEICWRAR